MNAALLGLTDTAQSMVVQRAQTAPAVGYRFSAFAPHEQDYEPSMFVFPLYLSRLLITIDHY